MTVTKAQQKAVAKYKAANYCRIVLDVPKDYGDKVKEQATKDGQSVTSWIKQAIDERMQK